MRHYIISPDRCLIHTQSPLIEGWEVCQDLKTLMAFTKNSPSQQKEEMKWVGPKIPANIWENVFGTMAKFPNMEIHLNIYHKITTGEWAIKCPKQRGSGASVSSEDNLDGMPKGFHMIGTIHSHPNMSAFWSGTDMNDQQRKYGLHFVFGLTNGLPTSYKCSIFTPRTHFDQEWKDVCEEVDFAKTYEPVNEWVETIKKQELKPTWSHHTNYGHTTYSFGGEFDWGEFGGSVDSWDRYHRPAKTQTKVDTKPAVNVPRPAVNWSELYKARQTERSCCTQEAVDAMIEGMRSLLDYLSNNDGIEALKALLDDYGIKVIDRDDQDRDFSTEFDELFEDYEEAGFPKMEEVNDVIENHGYKAQEDTLMQQTYFQDAALDAFEEQEAINRERREIDKC